jgi:hypothetical protein
VQIAIENGLGNVVTDGPAVAVTLAWTGAGKFLPASTITAVTVNGVATFANLIPGALGTFSLTAGAGSLAPATTAPMTISAAATSIALTVPASATYGAAASVSATVTSVLPISEGSVTFTVTQGNTTVASLSGSVVNGVASATLPASLDVGNYTVNAGFTDVSGGVYSGVSAQPAAMTVNPAHLQVTANPHAKTYGHAATESGSISGIVNADPISAVFTSAGDPAAADQGAYAISAALSDAGSGKLALDYIVDSNLANVGTLTINPKHIQVTANSHSKNYGQTATETGSITGIANNDPITAIFSSLGDPAGAVPGAYPVTAALSDAGSGKLALDYVVDSNLSNVGTLTVNDVAPTVVSINRATPAGAIAEGPAVNYAVTFNEPVTGLTAAAFASAVTGSVTVGSPLVVTPSPSSYSSVYNVTINGITGAGSLGLNLINSANVTDQFGTHVPLGTGATLFQSAQNVTVGNGPGGVQLADLNHDGKLDLIAANFLANTVSVLMGNGDGTFQAPFTFAAGSHPDQFAVADVNGDGKPDLVVTSYSNNSILVFLGKGDGTFQLPLSVSTGTAPRSVAVADFNGDGVPDIVVANSISNTASLFFGIGGGIFGAGQTIFSSTSGVYSVAAADVNGDGFPDIVIGDGSSSVYVLINVGNGGAFKPAVQYAAGAEPYAITLADVNGDGARDLLVADASANTVSVLLNSGNGTFQPRLAFATGVFPSELVAGDFNGDGHTDIAVSDYSSTYLSVLIGNGNGTFQAQQTFTTGASSDGIALGDINGDGALDLVAGVRSSNFVSVLLNNRAGTVVGQLYTIEPSTKLAYVQPPTSTAAGQPIDPGTGIQVAVKGTDGNTLGDDTSAVTLTLSSGTFVSTGTNIMTVNATNGVATFSNLAIGTAGNYTITAGDGSLTSTPAAPFTISPATASQLVFTQLPVNAEAGVSLNPPVPGVTVQIEDQFGNPETGDQSSIVLAVNSGIGSLGGTVSMSASNGVATFSNLYFTAPGDYTLSAANSTDGLGGFVSGTFTVGNPPGISPASGALYTITYISGAANLDVSAGKVTFTADLSAIFPNYALTVEDGAGVILAADQHLGALQMLGSASLDMTNHMMILDFGTNPDPILTVAQYLAGGYNGGAWNGAGINSSTAAANPIYAVGYTDGADGIVNGLSAGQIEIKTTLLGDANLDGIVNVTDLTILASHFSSTGTQWDQGDFSFDGTVNLTDLVMLANRFGGNIN